MRVKIMGCSPLLGDHLGSTSMTVNSDGTLLSEVRYSAFGEERYSSGTMTTDYLYTGQREEAEVGLYYYVARWYDPAIGRFIQADSIVPNPGSAVGLDRYSYAFNNPLKYSDPSGHFPLCVDGVECFTLPGYTGEEQWELGEIKLKNQILYLEKNGERMPQAHMALRIQLVHQMRAFTVIKILMGTTHTTKI